MSSEIMSLKAQAKVQIISYEDHLKYFREQLSKEAGRIIKRPKVIQAMQRKIQAVEGGRDVLSTYITDLERTEKLVDKNNYITYSAQVVTAYDMYMGKTDNGAEIFGAVTDSRVACIGGEGINFQSDNKAKEKWIKNFLKMNKLQGSNLLAFLLTGELEGKNLLILNPIKVKNTGVITGNENIDQEKSYVQVTEFLWVDNQYTVVMDNNNPEKIKTIKYKKNKTDAEDQEIKSDKAVYVRLGGTKRDINQTTHRMHRVLTQCENASRAGYDLRMNGHLFGKIKPVWTFDFKDQNADVNVKAVSKNVNSKDYDIGSGYVGTGDFKYVTPPGDGVNVLLKDIIENLRWIATNSGIPIHWLSYPDLMSNRSTADNVTRMMEYSTKKDRLIWEEAFKEIIEKAMIIAVESLGADNEILKGDFEIKLPLIDMDKAIEMIKELFVLVQANIIPDTYLLNRLPGADPQQMRADIEAQKEREKEEIDEKVKKEVEYRQLELRNRLDRNQDKVDTMDKENMDGEPE